MNILKILMSVQSLYIIFNVYDIAQYDVKYIK